MTQRSRRKTKVLLGFGTAGAGQHETILAALNQQGGLHDLVACAVVDLNLVNESRRVKALSRKLPDYSPDLSEIQTTMGLLGSNVYGEDTRPQWESVIDLVVQRIVQAIDEAGIVDCECLVIIGANTGHELMARCAMHGIKEQVPGAQITFLTVVAADQTKSQALRLDQFRSYRRDGTACGATLITHNASPFVKAPGHSLDLQDGVTRPRHDFPYTGM